MVGVVSPTLTRHLHRARKKKKSDSVACICREIRVFSADKCVHIISGEAWAPFDFHSVARLGPGIGIALDIIPHPRKRADRPIKDEKKKFGIVAPPVCLVRSKYDVWGRGKCEPFRCNTLVS